MDKEKKSSHCPAPLKLSHYFSSKGGIWDNPKAAFRRGLPEDVAAGGAGSGGWGGCEHANRLSGKPPQVLRMRLPAPKTILENRHITGT